MGKSSMKRPLFSISTEWVSNEMAELYFENHSKKSLSLVMSGKQKYIVNHGKREKIQDYKETRIYNNTKPGERVAIGFYDEKIDSKYSIIYVILIKRENMESIKFMFHIEEGNKVKDKVVLWYDDGTSDSDIEVLDEKAMRKRRVKKQENPLYSTYVEKWKQKIPKLVTLASKEKSSECKELLSYNSTFAPIITKIDIVICEDGFVTYDMNSMNAGEIQAQAKLEQEILDEIKRLMSEEEVQKQESCFFAAMDGHHSELTLFLDDNTISISNYNCRKDQFSISYRLLIYLVSSVGYTIEEKCN